MKFFSVLKRIFNFLVYPIKCSFAFFFFMYALGLLCFGVELSHNNLGNFYENAYYELFIDLYIICVILCLIPARIRFYVKGLLCFFLYLIAIVDTYCIVRFDTMLSPTMFQIISETNREEATEFFGSYISWDILASPLVWLFLLMMAHLLIAFRKFYAKRIHCPLLFNANDIKRRAEVCFKRCQPYLGLIVLIIIIAGAGPTIENKANICYVAHRNDTYQLERARSDHYMDGLYLPVYRLWFAYYANRVSLQQINKLNENADNIRVDSCSFRSPNIILIIGESYNKHHSQLYGYKKETTPRQMRRAKRGELIPFTDVVSVWNITSKVFMNAFSMKGIDEKGEWSDYPLFPEIFRKAGYHVSFMTNQFVQKADEDLFDFSGGSFLCDKKLSSEMFDCRNKYNHEFDEDLLQDYDSLKIQNGKNNLIIFHLIGQHATYDKRFPKNRHHFNYTDYDRYDISKKWRGIIANYDNATLYNDSVVDAIIRRFEHTDAIVIYMPDHGDECYDSDEHRIFGRTHSEHPSPVEARNEYEIPFWIWCSHGYMINHPQIYQQIISACTRPFMNDNLPHILLYLAGINCPYYKSQNNLLSPDFNDKRIRLLKGTDDYDKLMGTKKAKDEKYYN